MVRRATAIDWIFSAPRPPRLRHACPVHLDELGDRCQSDDLGNQFKRQVVQDDVADDRDRLPSSMVQFGQVVVDSFGATLYRRPPQLLDSWWQTFQGYHNIWAWLGDEWKAGLSSSKICVSYTKVPDGRIVAPVDGAGGSSARLGSLTMPLRLSVLTRYWPKPPLPAAATAKSACSLLCGGGWRKGKTRPSGRGAYSLQRDW